jgi:hypothetical protein
MKKKLRFPWFAALTGAALIVLLTGCPTDPEPESPPSFASKTDETTAANDATLGLTGATASSDNPAIATVEIADGKVKITSVAEGSATITVFDTSFNEATIPVTVSNVGAITIGDIRKYAAGSTTFDPKTIEVDNTVAVLGLVGTSATSSDDTKATVAIADSKVKITAVAAGKVTITVKDGTHEATIEVTVAASGKVVQGAIHKYDLSPNGKSYFNNSGDLGKIVFSTVESGTSGTYVEYTRDSSGSGDTYTITFEPLEKGTYSWTGSGTGSVTLTITHTRDRDWDDNNNAVYGEWQTKDEYIAAQIKGAPARGDNPTIEQLNALMGGDGDGFATTKEFYEFMSAMYGQTITTWAQLYDISIAQMSAEFDPTTYNYSFSADEKALFLDDPLPAKVGTNELSGKTFTGTQYAGRGTYDFTATGYTFTPPDQGGYYEASEGTYSYDSGQGTVYLKPSKIGGKTISEYYAGLSGEYFSAPYTSAEEYKAAQANGAFRVQSQNYSIEGGNNTIGWSN